MEEVQKHIDELFEHDIRRLILSQPLPDSAYKKIDIRLLDSGYQAQMFTSTQVFHKNLSPADAKSFVLELIHEKYLQLNAWTQAKEFEMRITKKGKVLTSSRAFAPVVTDPVQHDRKKRYLLDTGDVVPALVDMGVYTADGKVVSTMQSKFRQINRFLELIDDEIQRLAPKGPLHILDFGCGKSYLTFVLYHYFTNIRKLQVKMTGLDLKQDVIEQCNRTAAKYGYEHLSFQTGDIGDYRSDEQLDIVITLHACDTATDYALFHAVMGGAKMIFSVPCCQHELNGQMSSEEFSLLTRYGIVKERVAALMTDSIRANLLAYCGYRTQLMEFVELAHTPKNLLIRAVKAPIKEKDALLREVETVLKTFQFEPTLYRLLKETGQIGKDR